MKVSFIIPAYNSGHYIQRSIESITTLKIENYEIIVVNDGSVDNTFEIVHKMALSNQNIIIIDKENNGVSAARNDALDIAKGDFIMFVDADDYIIENLANLLKTAQNYDLSIFGMIRKSRNGTIFDWSFKPRLYKGREILELVKDMDALPLGSPWAKLFKADILRTYNIRFKTGQKLFEDACFVFQYLQHCDNVFVSDQAIYFYDTSGSVSSGFYGDVFFRDFKEYSKSQQRLIKYFADRPDNLKTGCAYHEVMDKVTERNSFQHIATIYKLYRSSISSKYSWLTKCLKFADENTPDWHKHLHYSVPKYIALLHSHPLILHMILYPAFKTEKLFCKK